MASAPISFDTFAFAQKLRGAGFTEPQVEAVTTGLSEIAMAQVATKSDLRDLEQRIVIRTVGATAAMLTLAVAVIKLF